MYLIVRAGTHSYAAAVSGTQAISVCMQAFQHHARRLATDPESVPQPAVDPVPAVIPLPTASERRPHFLPQPRRQPKTKNEVCLKLDCPVLVCILTS